MQAPWKPGGYLQEGRGGPVESSSMRAVVPTIFCESDDMCVEGKRRIFCDDAIGDRKV